jgi:hypothetical protein
MRTPPLLLSASLFLSGCAAPNASTASGHLGLGQVAALGTATAAGAVLGDKLGGAGGALIGGGAGLAAAAVVNNALATPTETSGADQARREERLKIMQRYWSEHTVGPDGPGGGEVHVPASPSEATLSYPPGFYGGIRFAPRTTSDPGLTEPLR